MANAILECKNDHLRRRGLEADWSATLLSRIRVIIVDVALPGEFWKCQGDPRSLKEICITSLMFPEIKPRPGRRAHHLKWSTALAFVHDEGTSMEILPEGLSMMQRSH